MYKIKYKVHIQYSMTSVKLFYATPITTPFGTRTMSIAKCGMSNTPNLTKKQAVLCTPLYNIVIILQ